MTPFSQRRAFTALMSMLAAAFVMVIWRQKYGWQSDFLEDLVKIGLFIAVSTAVISFIVWTLTRYLKEGVFRNLLAGAVTAMIIIPLPAMVWNFKTEFLAAYQAGQSGILGAALHAVPFALKASTWTFIEVTKASFIAVLGSMSLGALIAHFIPDESQPKRSQ